MAVVDAIKKHRALPISVLVKGWWSICRGGTRARLECRHDVRLMDCINERQQHADNNTHLPRGFITGQKKIKIKIHYRMNLSSNNIRCWKQSKLTPLLHGLPSVASLAIS